MRLFRDQRFDSREDVLTLLPDGHGVVVYSDRGKTVLYTDPINLIENVRSAEGINPACCKKLLGGLRGCSYLFPNKEATVLIKGEKVSCSGSGRKELCFCGFDCRGTDSFASPQPA